jgi:23S rRNA (uracil-5-)-methyltransferase RumA
LSICEQFNICGGCKYLDIPYEEQLLIKENEILKLFEKKGIKIEQYLGINASKNIDRYRNKMEYTFGDEVKDGVMTLGMHKKGSYMSIVTVDSCQLVDDDFNIILGSSLKYFTEKGYGFFHKKTHQGLLRNLIIRKGEKTKELTVNIVTTSEEFDEIEFKDLILSLNLKNKIVGVLRTINDRVADFVYCDELRIIYGQDYYNEEILGLKFKVSAFSFFQTNIYTIEKLYETAIEFVGDIEGKVVFDLYSGTGTIAQVLSTRAKKTIGIELIEEAVDSARENAKLNKLDNCEFIVGDVLTTLDTINEKPDIIVLDPPRVGIHPKALQKIMNYKVKQLLYISCNYKSLVENLIPLTEQGYKIKKMQIFDNFPHTKHAEIVCLLSL